jgi:hypothetical protein
MTEQKHEILLYQSEDGSIRLEVMFTGDSLWLTQARIAELFQTSPQNITQHIKNIYEEEELAENTTCKKYLQVVNRGFRGEVNEELSHYNLEMILAIGYRVRSRRGTQFRQWATGILSEYAKKGFALNDPLLKNAGGGLYWKELIGRIRDIRSSEKLFYRQILDIFATSVDYAPRTQEAEAFFKIIQNKMHFAAHGHTAAELQYDRADVKKPFMGLTSWSGCRPRKDDVVVAKNYLNESELDALNKITTAALDFAEVQALSHIPMSMNDWVAKMDDFLKVSGRPLLDNAGSVSKERADEKAISEYDKYRILVDEGLSPVEQAYLDNLKQAQKEVERKVRKKQPARRLASEK